ncbi:hypothetical protein [Mesorhizobium australicum]|uniref:Uncharacterized protein n=1 Tax=Mesorhizobium australicum TaxID=536018 RepID=A0A1X7PKW2_9HYPH|nr:hypothetical protein [Mesorhizobium australicum]SMH52348.1 hypothetical protein SAMN02982922_4650 [Mesorhizobium australicum]
MAGTVAAHIDEKTRERLRNTADSESRSPSQIMGVAVKTMLSLSPAARRALFAIDGAASEDERQLAMRIVGRSALKAHERLIVARHTDPDRQPATNEILDNETAIEAEAVELCR